ncbi:hypothetical protein FLJC2902T_22220 [Flavobacterium limnosediminis JC2902]|uniref:Lipoprotein n=1 Tax=Flavobacterium limnosediminis JC2902 TaxID=1341181 RepID=V6SKZ0_9FLAO|nr:DUF1254 domain-containing protein [Flavobacterium limnosediminis]ESU27114.1 hypothetical protein FLJC2902T_22220 [Flavobacterium limnosediminis JC2902]
MKGYLIITILGSVMLFASCNNQDKKGNMDSSDRITASEGTSAKQNAPAGIVPNTVMTEEYVKSMTKLIYLWGWPMVNVHNRVAMFTQLKEPMYIGGVLPGAPVNRICMLTDYMKSEQRVVACPNQDVVYGAGPLDLRKEPVVIQVPDFGDRFWVYQMADQRTDGFAKLGKMYNSKPGFYLFVGSDWNGKIPDGITGVFKCSTALGFVAPRVFQTDDPVDKKAVQPLINQITMYPLSEFDGKMKITDWAKTKSTPPDSSGGGETKWVVPETFFDQLPGIIKEVPPLMGEEAWYAQINGLLDGIAKNPKLKEVAKKAAADAEQNLVSPLFQFVNVGYPIKNNWNTQSNGAQFGVDYLTRAACAKANIFVNKPNETKYFYQDLDVSGMRLNGNNKYTVTFTKDQMPPVKGFWSLTMYSKEHFFVPNQLNRYSLGTKNKNLKYNADGSLTLYVQSIPPDGDKMTNWLPAPKEAFSLYVRCYWPDERVLNDSWNPPAVMKVK